MTNFWTRRSEDSYVFSANGKEYGTFQNTSVPNPFSANIKIENKEYTISRKGFWRTYVAIRDTQGTEVLSLKVKKWWGSSYIIDFENKKYSLTVGNNPLVHYTIFQENVELLSYALSNRKGELGLKISGLLDVPVFFHFLLWYLINPVISESKGKNGEMMLLNLI